ncbi:MAG TPA: hypothetical protein VIF62_34795 [Labilithrix sp.]|jgi:hypothetical protein
MYRPLLSLFLASLVLVAGCGHDESDPDGGALYGVTTAQLTNVDAYAPQRSMASTPQPMNTPYSGPIARAWFSDYVKKGERGVVVTLYRETGGLGPKAWLVYQPEGSDLVAGVTWFETDAPDAIYVMDADQDLLRSTRIEVASREEGAVEVYVSDALCAGTIKAKLEARLCRARAQGGCDEELAKKTAGLPDCTPSMPR